MGIVFGGILAEKAIDALMGIISGGTSLVRVTLDLIRKIYDIASSLTKKTLKVFKWIGRIIKLGTSKVAVLIENVGGRVGVRGKDARKVVEALDDKEFEEFKLNLKNQNQGERIEILKKSILDCLAQTSGQNIQIFSLVSPNCNIGFSAIQIQKKFKHAENMGFPEKNFSFKNAEAYTNFLKEFVNSNSVKLIDAKYRNIPIKLHIEESTGRMLMKTKNNEFWDAFKLSPAQLKSLKDTGNFQ
jgi:hypothetical protein